MQAVSSADLWFNLYFALPADKTTLCKSNTGNDALQKPRVAEKGNGMYWQELSTVDTLSASWK